MPVQLTCWIHSKSAPNWQSSAKARGSREVDLKSTIIPDRLTFFLLIDLVVYHLVGDGAGCDDQDEVNLEVVERDSQGGIVA